ncbi:MAG: deoxyribose-phosphate aldolase [Clostridia bacterium]|nr:deoxyribose-phosphate aldolase [Clostridia bacterium]
MKKAEIAAMIDHTQLKAFATTTQIDALCKEAAEYHFASVCVNPCHVARAAALLKGTGVKVCTVIGFPLGANTSEVKAFETRNAIENGAQECDMVINVGALKEGNIDLVEKDIRAVVEAANGTLVKVIIETCYLTDEEKALACQAAARAGADFVKTSTGFGTGGATPHDVALMRASIPDSMKVKASGGVHNYREAMDVIEAGASRIGASAGIAIVSEAE